MSNSHFADLAKLIMAFVLAIFQSDAKVAAAHTSMITVGDEVDGMLLTKGAADAPQLWAFCVSKVSKNVTTSTCRAPQMPKLAIGQVFLDIEESFNASEQSQLRWELYINDQFIDLKDFGTYDFVMPTISPSPSLVLETPVKFKAWDIILTNLQPGTHSIEGRVFSASEEYRWNVHLVIEAQVFLRQSRHQMQLI